MLHSIFGTLNACLILLSTFGVLLQLKTIYQRRQNDHCATDVLSLNQFAVTFVAYYSFYLYAISIEPFNHYLAWPRLIASLTSWLILIEIYKDRRSVSGKYTVTAATVLLLLGFIKLSQSSSYLDESKIIATTMILIISVLLLQGYTHQFIKIIRAGSTGAINLKMSQFILLMDISTLLFAATMPFSESWPLTVLAITSAITKIIMMYLFYWVRTSPVAKERREMNLA